MSRPLALLALGLGLCGCSALRVARAGPEAEAWEEVRNRFTRKAALYDRLETHAMTTAVWQAPEVRASRAALVASWRAMTAEERKAQEASEAAEHARWDEVLVILFTTDPRDNDLDARRSVWRVAAVGPKGERLPAEVRQTPVDSELRALYPEIHQYDLVYRVRFARGQGEGAGPFTLRIAGSEGRMDFPFGEE
jgi:hypothetical protein